MERKLSFTLEPVASLQDESLRAGAVGLLRATPFGSEGPHGRLGFAATFTDDFLAPAWEGLEWGYIRRYSIHDGQLATLRARWPVNEHVRPQLDYQLQLDEDWAAGGDELDLGVQLSASELYRFTLALSALDLVGPKTPSVGGYLEVRLVAGER